MQSIWVIIILQMVSVKTIAKGEVIPKSIQLTDLSNGKQVDAGSILSKTGNTLLVLNRHFAWGPWNDHLCAVQAGLDEIEGQGCKVVVVVSGTQRDALTWAEQKTDIKMPKYANPDWSLYRMLNLRRRFDILSTYTMRKYGEEMLTGKMPEGTKSMQYHDDDQWIMAGDFIVKQDGRLVYTFYQNHPEERPTVEELVQELKNLQ